MFKSSLRRFRTVLAALFIAASLGQARSACATVLLDQITILQGEIADSDTWASQVFPDNPKYNIAAVDDFTTTGIYNLTSIQALLNGFAGFDSYSNITGYEVNIYSSLAAANQSLTGNVAHAVFSPADVTLTFPGQQYEPDSALLSLPVNIRLPSAGTFYLAVLPVMLYSAPGQIGVDGREYYPAALFGDNNGTFENPGGGFNLPGNQEVIGEDLGYRVIGTAVPEPSTWALMGTGGVALFAAFLRRRPLGVD